MPISPHDGQRSTLPPIWDLLPETKLLQMPGLDDYDNYSSRWKAISDTGFYFWKPVSTINRGLLLAESDLIKLCIKKLSR